MYLFNHNAFGTLGLCEHPTNEIGQGETEVNKIFLIILIFRVQFCKTKLQEQIMQTCPNFHNLMNKLISKLTLFSGELCT